MLKLVLIRHGESAWNKENRFTGWADVDLSEKGLQEAKVAGDILKKNDFLFDISYTSVLKRAIKTLYIILEELDLLWIPVYKSWKLNERNYGALQGLNKAETAEKYGEEQVHKWRRYVDIKPPALDKSDSRYAGNEYKYNSLSEEEIPLTESLDDTGKRVLDYWQESIVPKLKVENKIIIAAHGNTIRALVRYLDKIPGNGIADINIPTGVPLVYELDENLSPIRHYYLGMDGELPEDAVSSNIQQKEESYKNITEK